MLFTKYNVEDALEVRYEEGLNAGLTAGKSAGIKEGGIRTLIETYLEFGVSPDDIVLKLVQKFFISREEAEKYLKKYGK